MKEIFNKLPYLIKKISIEDPNSMIDSGIEDDSNSKAPVIEKSIRPMEEIMSDLVVYTGNTNLIDDIDESDNEIPPILESKPISLAEIKQEALKLHYLFSL